MNRTKQGSESGTPEDGPDVFQRRIRRVNKISAVIYAVLYMTNVPTTSEGPLPRTIKPYQETEVQAYRLRSAPDSPPILTDNQITRRFGKAASILERDFNYNYTIEFGGVDDITVEPKSKEKDSLKPCYGPDEIKEVVENIRESEPGLEDPETQIQIIANDTAICQPDEAENGTDKSQAAFYSAFAGGYAYYDIGSGDGTKTSYFGAGMIAHELGHGLGMPHQGAVECENTDTDATIRRYPTLHDISVILGSPDSGCDYARYSDNEIDPYASSKTVMGSRELESDWAKLASKYPAFSSLDKSIAMPEVYRIKPISTEPKKYELGFGENETVGVAITLPEGHPIRRFDPSLEKLVITNEARTVLVSDGKRLADERKCDGVDSICSPVLAVASRDLNTRYDLPSPWAYTLNKKGYPQALSVGYIDQSLGIGILFYEELDATTGIMVVDYETANDLSKEQLHE